MADTVEGAIEQVLSVRLGSLVLSPVHPIAVPNTNFTKPTSHRYLEARFVPNATDRILVDGDGPHQRIGFLQVNVRDKINTGSRITDIAGIVAAHFPADLALHHATGIKVRITAAAEVNAMIVESSPPGVMVPILIPWECLA